jgi:hypothetical protein
VLLGEDGGRGQEERLLARDRDREGGANGDLGLAESDVATNEPVHRPRRLEVLLDRLDRALLVGSLDVREARFELLQEIRLDVVGHPGGPLALGIERDELARQLARAGAGACLDELPGLAAELRQRGRVAVRPHITRHFPDLLVRDVEAVVAAEGEEEIVARDPGDGSRLETEQVADPVILVDDKVARAQVGESLQGAAKPCVGPRRPLPEDLRVREEDEPELARHESTTGGRDREANGLVRRELFAGLQQLGLDLSEKRLRPQRLAAVGEGDHHPVPRADERLEIPLGLGEAARSDRRALRLEGVPLARGELVELDRLAQLGLRQKLLFPDLANLVELPDQVGWGKGGDEIGGRPGLLVVQRGLNEIEPALRGRMDDRLVQGAERPLGEGGEGAHRLDLVPEELDPDGLASGGGKDVDDSAPHREAAALFRSLDALVPGEGEALDQSVDSGLLTRPQANRLRPRLYGRQALGEADRRRADKPARLEDFKRPRALAH